MFNRFDFDKNKCQLTGSYAEDGYDRYWHTFTGYEEGTGKEKVFFVEYLIINPTMGWDEVKRGRGVVPSYTLVRCGAFAESIMERYIPMSEVESYTVDRQMRIVAGDCFLSEHSMSGRTEDGAMSWNLRIRKKVAYNAGVINGSLARKVKALDTFWHAQGMITKYCGVVNYKGSRYDVAFDTSYGYADKTWGDEYPEFCLWLNGSRLRSRLSGKELSKSGFAFAGLKPVLFGKGIRDTIVGALYYEGVEFDYNFARPSLISKTEYVIDDSDSALKATIVMQNCTSVLALCLKCDKNDMITPAYETTFGENAYDKLYATAVAKGRLKLYTKFKGALVLVEDMDVYNAGLGYGGTNI